MEIFQDKLKKLRTGRGMSQSELAQKLYVSRSAVAKWEQGRGFPNIDSLQLISKEFGVSIDELISDKEIKIIQIQTNKTLSVRTKLMITFASIIAALLCLSVILLALYIPRRLSSYIELEVEDVNEIYLEYYKFSSGEDAELVRVALKQEYNELFLDCLKNIKITPIYHSLKTSLPYEFYIYSGRDIYKVNGMHIYKNDTAKLFSVSSGSMEVLCLLFDIGLEDIPLCSI